MLKNVAGQEFVVFAWDTAADAPKTGDAANISAQITKDYGTPAATNDAAPTELNATAHPGIYIFDATQAETNANHILVSAVSSTPDVVLEPMMWEPEDLSFKGIVAHGQAQSASSTGVVLAAGEAFADDVLIGMTIAVFGSTQGYWQARIITDNALSGDTVTVNAWTVTPSGTITYRIYASAPGASLTDIAAAVLSAAAADPIAANVKEVDDDATAAVNLESYLDGTEFMPVDAHQQNFAVSGTSLTTKKPDGTTDTSYSPKSLTTDAGAEPITGAS